MSPQAVPAAEDTYRSIIGRREGDGTENGDGNQEMKWEGTVKCGNQEEEGSNTVKEDGLGKEKGLYCKWGWELGNEVGGHCEVWELGKKRGLHCKGGWELGKEEVQH